MNLQLSIDAYKSLHFFEQVLDKDIYPEVNESLASNKDGFETLEQVYAKFERFRKYPLNDKLYAVIDTHGVFNKTEDDISIVRFGSYDAKMEKQSKEVLLAMSSTNELMEMVAPGGYPKWQSDTRYKAGLVLAECFNDFHDAPTFHNAERIKEKVSEFNTDKVIEGAVRNLLKVVDMPNLDPQLNNEIEETLNTPRFGAKRTIN